MNEAGQQMGKEGEGALALEGEGGEVLEEREGVPLPELPTSEVLGACLIRCRFLTPTQ
jgi:hypothetical protein